MGGREKSIGKGRIEFSTVSLSYHTKNSSVKRGEGREEGRTGERT